MARVGVAKITISLPGHLLEVLERWQRERGETRSAVIRHALERALQEEQEQEAVRRWVEGYRKHPQTEEEVGWAAQASLEALADLPWEQ